MPPQRRLSDKEIQQQIREVLREQFASPQERLRIRAQKRIQERQGLYTHFIIYMGTIFFLWVIWFVTGKGFAWPILPMGGWGIGILAHAVSYYFYDNPENNDILIKQEIIKELERKGYQADDYDRLFTDSFF